jgi:hypothetical protein
VPVPAPPPRTPGSKESLEPPDEAIASHLTRGELSNGLSQDAVRGRLICMRNHPAHRYFDTAHSIVAGTVAGDLPPLLGAVERLLQLLERGEMARKCRGPPTACVCGEPRQRVRSTATGMSRSVFFWYES